MKSRILRKLLKGSRGAVSIFLVIILVPMMTVSCLFVDMSRIVLSKSLVESAADLTLNSALTKYDSYLQEYYGLFATSQDIDSFLADLKTYFYKCVRSAGMDETDAWLFSAGMVNMVTGGDKDEAISDLLCIGLGDGFSVSRKTGGSLCNPTLLKSQIVNFMKYRAPINAGLSLISSLKSFANLSKEAELIENRQNYYKAEKDVNTDCQNAWNEINEYNKLKCCTDATYFTVLRDRFSNNSNPQVSFFKRYWSIFNDAAKYIYISNSENTDELLNYTNPLKTSSVPSRYTYPSGQNSSVPSHWYYVSGNSSVYTQSGIRGNTYSIVKDKKTLTVNTPSKAQLESAIENAYKKYIKLSEEKNAFQGVTRQDGWNDIRYVYYCRDNSSAYTTAAKDFVQAMQKVEECYKWVPDPSLESGFETIKGSGAENNHIKFTTSDFSSTLSCEGKTQSISSWYNDLLGKMITGNNSSLVEQCYSFASSLENTAKTAKTTYDTKLTDINNRIGKIQEEIDGYSTVLKDASEHLGNASEYLGNVYTSVTEGALVSAKQTWSNNANNASDSSTIASQDKAEIDKISKHFKPEDIQALKDRIDKIKENIDDTVKKIDDYKIGSKKIIDIKDYDDLRGPLHAAFTNNSSGKAFNPQRVENKKGNPPETDLNIEKAAEQAIKDDKAGFKSGNIKTDWVDQQSSNPNLRKHILDFYTYLYKNFNSTGDVSKITLTDNNEVKTEKEAYKDTGDKAQEDIANAGKDKLAENNLTKDENEDESSDNNQQSKNISDIETRPSTKGPESISGETGQGSVEGEESATVQAADTDNAASSAKSSTSNIFKNIGDVIKNVGTSARDDLYVTEYIMNMLSYDTINYSGNASTKPAKEGKEIEGTIKSLTMNPIDESKNLAYKSEVEYILYGGSNAANVATAYATIYAIRLAFNLIYAFSDAELRNTALAIATPLSAATCGVVPVPLIQAGLLVAAAAAESGIDLVNLKGGEKVALYKNKQTWHISLSNGLRGALQEAGKEALNIIDDNINTAIDTGLDALSSMLDSTSDELNEIVADGAGTLEKQIGDAFDAVISEQVSMVVNEITSSITSKIQQSLGEEVSLTSDGVTSYVIDSLKDLKANDTSDGMIKQVRDAAIDYIITNPERIKNIYDKMNACGDCVDPESLADSLEGELKTTVTQIKNNIIGSFSEEINKAKDAAKDAAKQGADKLKETIGKTLDNLTGSSPSAGTSPTTSGTASFFSFSYQDYIKLFLFLKLATPSGETTVMMRLADILEANMTLVKGKQYDLSKSACYVTLHAEYTVKPMFLAVPIVAPVSKVSKDGGEGSRSFCYTFKYDLTKGY